MSRFIPQLLTYLFGQKRFIPVTEPPVPSPEPGEHPGKILEPVSQVSNRLLEGMGQQPQVQGRVPEALPDLMSERERGSGLWV